MSADSSDRYVSVTELAGDDVSVEQIQRLADRYVWASGFCEDKDVIEVACGTGQGLGLLAGVARSLQAGDISPILVAAARSHYRDRVDIKEFAAEQMPVADASKDVVIIFEAIYYLPDVRSFFAECARVLRPDGKVLIATANKNLPDFTPSPHAHAYYGPSEFVDLLRECGFTSDFYGNTPLSKVSPRQRMLRPLKVLAARLDLMPKTMASKKYLKRLMFGSLVPMPNEISRRDVSPWPPVPLDVAGGERDFKVLLCAASRLPVHHVHAPDHRIEK